MDGWSGQAQVDGGSPLAAQRGGRPVIRHGSESYFIIGEGLLGESLDGRVQTLSAAVEQGVPPFRFSRMGPKGTGKQLGEPTRRSIAEAMTASNLTPGTIPAGFTYL